MKKLLPFLLFALFLTSSVLGQVSAYSFSSAIGTYTTISGGTFLDPIGTVDDDNSYSGVPIGFNFVYNGTTYTTLGVNSNGYCAFGGTAPGSYYNGTSIQNVAVAVHPFSEDLYGTSATCEIEYLVTGSVGSRIFTLQWKDWGFYSTGGSEINFQLKLYETTNVIKFVYNPGVPATSQTCQAGLTGTTTADFQSRTTTTDWTATTASAVNTAQLTWTAAIYPPNGLTYTWTPPPPPPSIVYTPLLNTSSTLARTLTTTITSPSGIPTSGIGLPVLYWRINAGAWTSSQAQTPVIGSTYNFTLGGGVVSGDVIQYYVVAQDAAGTPLLSANPSAGVGALTPNPPAAASPPVPPNSYTIVPTICGTKIIGPGGDYTTLTAAVAALNGSIMTCAVSFLFNASYSSASETFPIVINQNAGASAINTLTIKPNTGVTTTISGSLTSALIKVLNNYTIIDGSNTALGTTQNLTISNTSLTTPQVLVIGSTGTTPITNCTLKNTIIINGANTSSAIIVSDGTVPGNPGYFNNITLQNNSLQLAYIAMYCNAVVAAGNGSGLLITGNTFNTSGANSIRLVAVYVQGVDGATVSNNIIGNFANTLDAANETGIWFATGTVNSTISGNTISALSGTAGGPRGIALSSGATGSNLTVTGNTITNISTTSSGNAIGIYFFSTTTGCKISNNMISNIKNTNSGGWLATAIYLGSTAAVSANCTVVNNAIWDVAGYGYSGTAWNGNGMLIYSGFGYNVYFNTVYMNTEQTSASGIPAALFVYSSVTAAGAIDLRNNIFSTIQTVGTNRYAIYSAAPNTVFSNIDYNDYYTTGPNLGFIGSNRATLADIQAGFGGNVNSLALNPTFVGTDLHPTNVALRLKGIAIGGITTDITGAFRTNPPDIGAYQFSPVQIVITTAATAITLTGGTLNGSITASNLTVTSGFDYGLSATPYSNSIAGVPPTVSGNTATSISAIISGFPMNTVIHYRAKGTNGSLTVYGSDMTFTTGGAPIVTTELPSLIGPTFATLNGTVNPNWDNTTVSFEYGTVSGGPYPIPVTVPGTFSGNTVQTFSATLSGLIINTDYYYRAKAINGGGTVYGVQQHFFTTCVTPPAPGAITGPGNVCKNSTGHVYSIAPVPYGFIYIWSFPAGFTISSYPYSYNVTVDVSNSAVSGLITVHAQSDCGANGPNASMSVTVNNLPTPTITGNSPVCQGAGNNYTTQAGKTSYVWTATPDGTITPTSNPNVVSITWPTTGAKTVGVIYTDPTTGCTAGTPGTLPVTVNAAPILTITGQTSLCVNSGYYTYTTQSGLSNYSWTVSSGGTITNGQGTNTAQVSWTSSGAQTVSVTASNTNGCYPVTPPVLNVTVNPVPDAAGGISGTAAVCAGATGIAYSVSPIANAITYVWTLPAGATIAGGAGTNNITVNFAMNASSGDITVYGNNTCGNGATSPPFTVTVTPLPGNAGSITGSPSVCIGASGELYSVAPIADATGYVWTVPQGATITGGSNTNSITVDFGPGAVSGNITVYGTNSCGNGNASPNFAVTVNPIPPTPVIGALGDTLASTAPLGNQWYFEGTPLPGATGQIYIATQTGNYWDVVTLNGCSSDTSNHVYVVITGIIEISRGNTVTIYPNPSDGQFTLVISSTEPLTFGLSVVNNLGVTVFKTKDLYVNGTLKKTIDLRPVPEGVYTIVLQNNNNQVVKKIIVNK